MKKLIFLLLICTVVFLQGCGGGDDVAAAVNETTTDYNPIIGFDLKSSTETNVEISSQESGVVVKYTTDGTTPTFSTSNTDYSFTITSETTIKARTFDSSGNALSEVVSKTVPIGTMSLTIMYYGDADNDLEEYLLGDVAEMKSGYSKAGYNLITLFDRVSGYSSNTDVFGTDEGNFTDTRLYKIGKGTTTRLDGSTQLSSITTSSTSELNMGDADTLKAFIDYCKANYPAEKYVLIISNHGGGSRSVKSTVSKDICQDFTDGDIMYTGEISDTLTSSESVDVMVLDACLMGSVEFAYQFRNDSSNTGFSADYMVASPASVWRYGLPYTAMLQRIRAIAGNNGTTNTLENTTEAYVVPSATNSMKEFAKMVVEEQYDSVSSQTFSAYDLSKVKALKTAIDTFAVSIKDKQTATEAVRGSTYSSSAMNYMSGDYWEYYPFFDIYDLMRAIKNSSSFTTTMKTNATAVQTALDNVIITSFGGSDFKNRKDSTSFVNNKNGMHIVFPKTGYASSFGWYSPVSTSYGKLSFCSGGTQNGTVENWFEMIDKWYDTGNYNGYNY